MASSTIQRSAFTGQTALKQSNELLRKVGIFANGRVSMRRTVKSAPQHIWLFWLSKRDEVYSIKVGYRLLVEDELSSSVSPLPTLLSRSPWKSLWKLRDDAKECSTFRELFQVCLEKGFPTNLFAMVSSHIWLKRKKLRLGELMASLRMLNSLASEDLLEFQ
nr:chlorophyll a-b binding protein 2.1, chloroplastic [Quercus suber]